MRSWRVFGLMIVVVFLLGTALSMEAMAQQKVFKLGVLGPMTGAAAKSGNEIKDGTTLAFEKMGYKIGDYKIELVIIDDQSDPAKGVNAYTEAIERLGVQAGVSNWNTAVTVAIQDILRKYKVPHFFCEGAGKAGLDKYQSLPPDQRYLIMKGYPIPQKLTVGYVDCVRNAIAKGIWKPEKKLAAFWGEDTDWGRSLVGGIRDGLKKDGWSVYTEEYFTMSATDFYAYLGKCKAAGVTLLAGSTSGAASNAAIVKQAREIGLKAMFINDGLGWIGEWYSLTGAASDGVLDMEIQYKTPAQKAWAADFEKRFNYKPGPVGSGLPYDYAFFFAKIAKRAIEKYGKLDSESLFKVGSEEVATGKLTYTEAEGAILNKRYRTTPEDAPDPVVGEADFYFPVVQYKGGKGIVVYPEYIKDATVIAP
jgi:branched-chain amino acid transport system substrate-binding protein